MSRNRNREQGVLFTTLVDFLLQVVFLLVLLIYPVMSYIDRPDSPELNRLYPHVKNFIEKIDDIDWQRLELALVPKEISKAYASEPEKLSEDLREVMRKAGLDPDKASIADLKKAIGDLKDKADKYDKYVIGTPNCSLNPEAGERYASKITPLLNVRLVRGGFEVQAASADADAFLKSRLGIHNGNHWTRMTESEYEIMFGRINALDTTCRHFVNVSDETPPNFSKEDYKRLIRIIAKTSKKPAL